jgi:hypothetical protein
MSLHPRRRTRLRLIAVMGAVLALLATVFLGTVSAQAAQGCEVDTRSPANGRAALTPTSRSPTSAS